MDEENTPLIHTDRNKKISENQQEIFSPADSAESTPPIFADKSQINLRSSAIQSTQISRKYFLIQMTQRIHRRFTQIRKKKSAFICGPISTNQREMFSPVNSAEKCNLH